MLNAVISILWGIIQKLSLFKDKGTQTRFVTGDELLTELVFLTFLFQD